VDVNTIVLTLLALFSALVVGAILMITTTDSTLHAFGNIGSAPGKAFSTSWDLIYNSYGALAQGSLESGNSLSETLVNAAPLMLAGMAVALAFRAGLFNIGAQGQIICGAILASWVGFSFAGLPTVIHVILGVAAGFVGGAIAGGLVGYLKARTGAHEVIVTIMFNYIALDLLLYLLGNDTVFRRSGQQNAIGKLTVKSGMLPHLAGDGVRLNWGIIVAVLAAAGTAWLLTRSTIGFRFRMLGANQSAARAAGVNIGAMMTLVMLISGGLAGLAGGVQVLGINNSLGLNYGDTLGFTAITVALLGRSTPLGVVLASLLYGALDAGQTTMQATTGVPVDLILVIQAVIVFFIAAPALIRDIYRIKGAGGSSMQAFTGGWSS
jgi:general nucleoside transport system permease protein